MAELALGPLTFRHDAIGTDEAGGEVIGEPMAIPGVGEYVVFRDTEGNHNSMMQPNMEPPACKT